MIESDVLNSLPLDRKLMAITGLQMLCDSGLIEEQQQVLRDRVFAGPVDESNKTLSERILVCRRSLALLEELKQLGESTKKET